ncbi:MAG: D-tyrosyl-tRNA(Tyr) deacylase [Anaerolineaceae bacterium]|nr:D-tyrosyl-tRNA(Tyr) deacylase [Anaerolineaceae bacterium]
MRAVVQRVKQGSVAIAGERVAEIGQGMVILLGVGPEDDETQAEALARKIARLRIFSDADDKMNLSLLDIKGDAIVVSQFTLYANTRKGNRPSFVQAAPPEIASPLVDRFVELLRAQGVPTQTGEFGADMLVEIANDGPVTILLEM